nr:hypothetical protein [Euryarchaeota archaeon]
GSYIDLFLFSAITQILFSVSMYWVFIHNVNDFIVPGIFPYYSILAIGTLALLGWMMLIVLGIGFDRLPLDHKSAPFDRSTINTVATLNVVGQLFITVGILTGDIQYLQSLGMIGGSILGLQLIMLGPLGRKIVKERKSDGKEKVGMWGVGTLTSLPIIGMLTILVWLFADTNWLYMLYYSIVVEGFWLMVSFAFILAHFQQRLDWKLMDAKTTNMAFTVFVSLTIIHLILEYLFQSGTIADRRVQASISLPILWVFFVSRPVKIWKHVFAGKKCSAQLLSAHSWLLSTAFVGVYETFFLTNMTDMFYTRLMLMFGIIGQSIWGSAVHLHYDHTHTNIEDREERWVSVGAMMIVMFGIFYLILARGGHVNDVYSEFITFFCLVALLAAYLEFMLWLFSDVLNVGSEWHRMPMFYSGMDSDTGIDPYFPNDDSSE